jgi:hypothetical protein
MFTLYVQPAGGVVLAPTSAKKPVIWDAVAVLSEKPASEVCDRNVLTLLRFGRLDVGTFKREFIWRRWRPGGRESGNGNGDRRSRCTGRG